MTAIRIIDDHLELANIGTKTHAQIDTHIADPSAHHVKYTDAEAVAAADASDKFVERNTINSVTASTEFEQTVNDLILKLHMKRASNLFTIGLESQLIESTNTNALGMTLSMPLLNAEYRGTDLTKTVGSISAAKLNGSYKGYMQFKVGNSGGGISELIRLTEDSLDIFNLPIKDLKNDVDATLSGTPRLFEVWDGSTPYYIRGYPTKT